MSWRHSQQRSTHLRTFFRVAFFAWCLSCVSVTEGVAAGWRVGVARAKITPTRPMLMSGYASRDRVNNQTLSNLWCKVCVLEDDAGNRAVLVSLDLIGVDREFSETVAAALDDKFGIQRAQLAICSSHTHTGPVVRGNLRPMYRVHLNATQRQAIDEYSQRTQQKIIDCVSRALDDLEDCDVRWGSGEAKFATNRRENRPADKVRKWRTSGQLKGPFDHDVPVLAAYQKPAENQPRKADPPKAILFGYACHATVLSSYEWSGDYPGYAQEELESQFPGTTAMFWAGCGADQNPLPRRSVELAKHYGRQLAVAVESVLLTTEMQPISSKLRTTYKEIDLAYATPLPTLEDWQALQSNKDRFVAARAALMIEELQSGKPQPTDYPYPISTWRLGEQIDWIFLGGEVVVDYALRLKNAKSTWVAGYAHDVMAYIPSRRVLIEGGYEGGGAMVYYGLPAAWSGAVEETIISAVDELRNGVKSSL